MIKAEAKRLGLNAPSSFWITDEPTLAMITGGCGPGAIGNFGWFDAIWGLNVRHACAIHDFEYGIGTALWQKDAADTRMFNNMMLIINSQSQSRVLRCLRRYRATSYYNAVSEGGTKAFLEATIMEAPVLTPAAPHHAPWFQVALREMKDGIPEKEGSRTHNPKIIEYHKTTSLKAESDEVAWCSSFVNWCMFVSDVTRTNKANARSWLSWGKPIDEPRIGCVVIFKRGLSVKQGHVGFYAGTDDNGNIYCLGGNQKNKVCISTYSKNKVIGYRWVELTSTKQGT